jgi:hypothetical protein
MQHLQSPAHRERKRRPRLAPSFQLRTVDAVLNPHAIKTTMSVTSLS